MVVVPSAFQPLGCRKLVIGLLLLCCFAVSLLYPVWQTVGLCGSHAVLSPFLISQFEPHMGKPLSFLGKGKVFDPSLRQYIQSLEREPADQRKKLVNWTPTFVTAASENHFREMRGMIHSMQQRYPNAKFVVYDLGLSEPQVPSTTQTAASSACFSVRTLSDGATLATCGSNLKSTQHM